MNAANGGKNSEHFYQPGAGAPSPCLECPNSRGECIGCSHLVTTYNRNRHKASPDLRKWWAARVKHIRPPETEAMIRGREIHEQLEREYEVSYDLNEVFGILGTVGGKIRWSARLCSRANGIRGQPDWVESTRTAPDKLVHYITEAKSHPTPHRKLFIQAAAYALLLSDPKMIANGLYFYDCIPAEQSFNVDIDFRFFYYTNKKSAEYQFVRDWKFVSAGSGKSPSGMGVVFGVRRIIRKFSGLSRVTSINDIPRCGYCSVIDSPKSTLNGGDKRPEDLCHLWQLCSTDLLSKQHKLGQWVKE